MSPKTMLKKRDKAHKINKGNRDNKRPPVTSRPAHRMPAVSPVVKPLPAISTLEFPALTSQPTDSPKPVKKWCFKNGSLVINPFLKKSYFLGGEEVILSEGPTPAYSLKRGSIVHVRQQNVKIPGDVPQSSWSEITYEETAYDREIKQWVTSRVTGWVNDAYLDDYIEKFPDFEVEIPHATKNSNDPQQFMTIEDEGFSELSPRTNMCGQLCVAFVLKKDIDTILRDWKNQGKKNYYQSLVGKGQNKTTTQEHLKDILDLHYTNPEDVLPYRVGLTAIPLAAPPTEPNYPHASNELRERLKTYSLITLVRIDLNSGELKPVEQPGQRNHWIVVEKITRNGNRVELYNPFPNKRQEYSFQEFYKAVGSNPASGWWVKREKRKSISFEFSPEDFRNMRLPLKVKIDNPNPIYTAAQYIDVEGKKKTNLCGEFCVAFLVKDSINAVLEKWKNDQPLLYGDIVVNNKPTGPHDLITILKSYGYNNEGDIIGFSAVLGDPYNKQYLPSPGRIAKMLQTHFLIAGVNIDGRTGKLKPSAGVPHWVVVDKITPIGRNAGGNGGWVELYNPFSNDWEEYSYNEFTASIGPQARDYGAGWTGLWVKRNIIPKFIDPIVVAPSGAVGHVQGRVVQKSGRPGRWAESHLIAVLKQRVNSGKPANRIAADLVKISGWKKEDILNLFKKIAKGSTLGKWSEAQLRAEIEKRRQTGKNLNKIIAELSKISGWKNQEMIRMFKKANK
jgi:hypothetical protein